MSWQSELRERVAAGGPLPFPIAAVLSAAVPLQRLGMWWRLRGPRERLDARVISFGNITAGGTGKTPAVIERVERELASGRTVAVLTRGYGARTQATSPIVLGGAEAASRWDLVGDEPALIARRCPGAVIARSADRVAAARLAIERFACDTLILDDGYQYVRLERDDNFVVINASNPFGSGYLLPRGILREPVSALTRATHVTLTHCDRAKDLEGTLEIIQSHCPQVPVRKTRHAPENLWLVKDGAVLPLEQLRGESVTGVCAIGNPTGFRATLVGLGAAVTELRTFRDHAEIPPEAFRATGLVVTTEKDAVRLETAEENVLALRIALRDVDA
ncbi:MAG: tetraacyldisaccharide 4'-kinase [Candidatus Hydrogenedentes bacterium]|nr:tetraacyldisaccharide 4'-kinase [Candidatus Hydrogenedentota bacterium]